MFGGHSHDEGLFGPQAGEFFWGETQVILVDDGGRGELAFEVMRDDFRVGGEYEVELLLGGVECHLHSVQNVVEVSSRQTQ